MFGLLDPTLRRFLTAAAAVLVTVVPPVASRAASIDEQVQDHVEAAVDRGLDPMDFHHLVLASRWRNTLEDWTVMERAVDRLSAARPMDPLMSDEVRRLRAELAVEAGHPSAALELFRAAGGISQWWALGPESIGELEDFSQLATLPASDAGWRPAQGTDPLGWVRLSGFAWPARRQMLYLGATLHSEREQPVAVRLGAAQVARAWLNGREVLTTAKPLRHADDQYAEGAWLAAGANVLVVAVASESSDWWLRVRLTAPDGSRLQGVSQRDRPPGQPAGVDREPPEVRDMESELRQALAKNRDGAALALAAYLVDRHPQPVGAGDARSVCRAARADSAGEARLLEWLLPAEPGTKRELLEGAIAADGDLHWARIALSGWYQSRRLFQEAADVLNPSADVPAVRAALLNQEAEQWGQVILPEMVQLARRFPNCVTAAETLADWAIRLARWDAASEGVARLAAVVPGRASVLELEQQLAEDCGDSQRIRHILTESVRQDPNRPDERIRLARLVAADEGPDGARPIVSEGLDRCPGHVELLMELAGLELDAGQRDRAAELAREVVAVRPQDRRAQRMLAFLGQEAEDLGWLRTPEELWALADDAPDGRPAVIALDHVQVRFLPSQLTETLAQQAFLITEADRADELLTHTLPHVPERHRLRVLQARILRRDGTQVNARQSDTPRLAEPEINLFYDSRLRVFRFPEVEDGDLIELAWVLSETAESNDTGPYKGGILQIGHPMEVGLAELELTGPAELLPAWELVHIQGDPTRVEDPDGTIHLRWTWRDMAAVPPDTPPAPRLSMTPYLVYSNHPEWGDLATWYERHVAPRVRPSRQVEETAQRLTEGAKDRLDKIARVYHFVTSDIRYVGLEFGEHRFRPFSADWVLNHKFGDCKDKSALLVALFDALDIPARMVMVRTADLGVPESELAILEDFNHAIVYLPEDDLWLDGTASGHAPYPPPGMNQGARVLVVDGPDSVPEITPTLGAGFARYSYRLSRSDGGFVDLEVRTEDTGEAADSRRMSFAGSQDPVRVERWLQTQFPGSELVGEPELRMIHGRDPAVMEVTGRISGNALRSAGGINTFPGEFDWAARLTPSGERHGPLQLPVRPVLEWTLEVDLGRPPRDDLPAVDVDTQFGRLEIDSRSSGSGYIVEGSFKLHPVLVPAADAGDLRSFLVDVERHLQRLLEVP